MNCSTVARAVGVCTMLLMGSCDQAVETSGWAGRRSSHGDTTEVLSSAPVLGTSPSALTAPVTIWQSDSLVRPTQIERDHAGALYVVDGWRVFRISPKGALLGVIGKKGSGPGEFRQIDGIRLDDSGTVLVFDGALRRLSTLDTNGRMLSVATLTPPEGHSSARPGRVMSWGNTIALPWAAGMVRADGVQDSVLINAMQVGADSSSPIVSLPDVRWAAFDGIFAPATAYDAAPIYAFGKKDQLVVADGLEPCFSRYRYNEKVEHICRAWTRDRVSQAERSASALADVDVGEVQRKFLTSIITHQSYPERRSSLAALRVTENDMVWARMIDSSRVHPMLWQFRELRPSTYRWSVFARDGRWAADLQIASNFTPMLIESDSVYGLVEDDDGVAGIAVMALPARLVSIGLSASPGR